jgi:16S rRNA (adenine1518-N6/adenine1519-N6)-dimethyltransferase
VSGARGGFPPVLKKFGQHFLNDERVLESIADAVGATTSDTVVEIGPGRGALTDLLVERAGRVIAVELDRALANILRDKYRRRDNIDIVEADVLKISPGELGGSGYILAGNVPYYITTPIIFHAMIPPLPKRAVFLVQEEVADRMVSPPGSKEYGALSVNLQTIATVEILSRVPASAFHPPPKVESAVVRITPGEVPDGLDLVKFRAFVQGLFGQRRKQLQKSLRSVVDLEPAQTTALLESVGIEPSARPEEISPSKFLELFRAVK